MVLVSCGLLISSFDLFLYAHVRFPSPSSHVHALHVSSSSSLLLLQKLVSMAMVKTLHQMSAEANLTDKKLSLAEIGRVTGQMVHSGWLQLRSEGVFNSYTKYWFLMDPEAGKLRYFQGEVDLKKNLKQKQLACINVSQMTSLDELEPSDKASRNPSIRGPHPCLHFSAAVSF
jgi:hypothetical protein